MSNEGQPPPESSLLTQTPSSETNINEDSSNLVICDSAKTVLINGSCNACGDENAFEKSVKCLFCHHDFHALCRGDEGKIFPSLCNKTFFDLFSKRNVNSSSLAGCFPFVCTPCMTKFETREAASVKKHVFSLEERMKSMEGNIETIKSLLSQKPTPQDKQQVPTTSSSTLLQPSENPWSNTQRLQAVRSKLPLVIKKSTGGDSLPDADIEKIVRENNILVEESYENKSGSKVIVVNSAAHRDVLTSEITKTHPGFDTQSPAERLPTVSIANIRAETNCDDLRETVLSLNRDVRELVSEGATFTVLAVRKQRLGNNFHATVRMSSDVRTSIHCNNDQIYLGMYSCPVYDHFYVKRCNKCQRFHHYKNECKAKPCCGKCAGEHETEKCDSCDKDNFVPVCVNCKRERQLFGHSHPATSRECFSYIAAQDALKKSISYYASKN